MSFLFCDNSVDRDKEHIENLQDQLERCQVVTPKDVSEDLITMNYKVRFQDLGSGQELTYTYHL